MPIEVVAYGYTGVLKKLKAMGARVDVGLRMVCAVVHIHVLADI